MSFTFFKKSLFSLKKQNSFVQNVAYNLSGDTIVLIIGFLLTPIIAKIYGPDSYGYFALFTSVCSLIIPFATMQLQAGFVASKSRIEFFALSRLAFAFLISISLLSFFIILFYNIVVDTKLEELYFYIPIYVFFSGLFTIIRGWNIKLQEFKFAAKSRVLATIIGKSSTLSIGMFYMQSAIGIIAGSIITFGIETIGLVSKKLFTEARLNFRQKIKFSYYIATLRRFKQYPTYLTFNTIINGISLQLPIYFIASYYTKNDVGLFSLSASLIQIPLNLMGTSVGAVFLPKIAKIITHTEHRNKTIVQLYQRLFYPGVVLLIVLAFVLGSFLTLLLGIDWEKTSHLSSFMAISFAFGVVSIPLSVVFRLIEYEKTNLLLTLFFIFVKTIALIVGGAMNDFSLMIFIYFFITLVQNAMQLFFLFRKLTITVTPIIRDFIIVAFIYLFSYYLANN